MTDEWRDGCGVGQLNTMVDCVWFRMERLQTNECLDDK